MAATSTIIISGTAAASVSNVHTEALIHCGVHLTASQLETLQRQGTLHVAEKCAVRDVERIVAWLNTIPKAMETTGQMPAFKAYDDFWKDVRLLATAVLMNATEHVITPVQDLAIMTFNEREIDEPELRSVDDSIRALAPHRNVLEIPLFQHIIKTYVRRIQNNQIKNRQAFEKNIQICFALKEGMEYVAAHAPALAETETTTSPRGFGEPEPRMSYGTYASDRSGTAVMARMYARQQEMQNDRRMRLEATRLYEDAAELHQRAASTEMTDDEVNSAAQDLQLQQRYDEMTQHFGVRMAE
ncbi:hypothetical protein BDV96DRAFT_607623 [Lophiotrema nucula]|uniref:Uncharacterized protein n=1 Tax=Lophiotrema nucula TaxID=690887 RepID=A0A6A5YID6_9PLEO|nr:hypothetical protein BDV96DRAFT_607623 [Lophiotrema nucula]